MSLVTSLPSIPSLTSSFWSTIQSVVGGYSTLSFSILYLNNTIIYIPVYVTNLVYTKPLTTVRIIFIGLWLNTSGANWLTWHLLWLLSRHMVWAMHWTFRSTLIAPYKARAQWNFMYTRLLWQVDGTTTIRSTGLLTNRNVRSIDCWLPSLASVLIPLVWFSHHWHLQNFAMSLPMVTRRCWRR